MSDDQKLNNTNVEEEKALPNPMDVPEIAAPKAEVKQEQPQVVIKKGMFGNNFVATMFLLAFFLVSFTLGTYAERNQKLASALGSNAVAPGNQAAQAGVGANQQQVLGLEDGKKVDAKINLDKARTKGSDNAKVTIVEYSDFECPFCESFYTNSHKELIKKYVDTGKVKIAFKDFPLGFHKNAQGAAEASRCAAEQGKFWEMHDKLFENQQLLSKENYKKWAGEIALDTNKFNQCVDSEKYKKDVLDELNEGVALGVQGTPSFVINGVALVGAQPLSAFEKIIEEQLK